MKPSAFRFAAVYLSLLFLLTLWILLDTFVIEQRLSSATDTQILPEAVPVQETVITESSWTGPGIRITLSETRYAETTIHLADIVLDDIRYLQTALAQDTYGRNIRETVEETAERHHAILAINGDYYGSRRSGYVIRNGTLYRESSASRAQEDLCIWPDGSMSIVKEGDVTARKLLDAGVLQVFSFGPALVLDGQTAVDPEEEVGRAMASNPRTALAMYAPLHFLFVVSDGRTSDDAGLSLRQLADFLSKQSVSLAYNLDGGGSSTMVFMDHVINWPTTTGRRSERAVSDIVYISTNE